MQNYLYEQVFIVELLELSEQLGAQRQGVCVLPSVIVQRNQSSLKIKGIVTDGGGYRLFLLKYLFRRKLREIYKNNSDEVR